MAMVYDFIPNVINDNVKDAKKKTDVVKAAAKTASSKPSTSKCL